MLAFEISQELNSVFILTAVPEVIFDSVIWMGEWESTQKLYAREISQFVLIHTLFFGFALVKLFY